MRKLKLEKILQLEIPPLPPQKDRTIVKSCGGSIKYFFNTFIAPELTNEVKQVALYEAYVEFCRASYLNAQTRQKFTLRLKEQFDILFQFRSITNPDGSKTAVPMWRGIIVGPSVNERKVAISVHYDENTQADDSTLSNTKDVLEDPFDVKFNNHQLTIVNRQDSSTLDTVLAEAAPENLILEDIITPAPEPPKPEVIEPSNAINPEPVEEVDLSHSSIPLISACAACKKPKVIVLRRGKLEYCEACRNVMKGGVC